MATWYHSVCPLLKRNLVSERKREREGFWRTWAELERSRNKMEQPVNLTATVGGSALL